MTEPFTRLECCNRLGLRGRLGRNPHLVEGLSGDGGSRAASPSAVPEAVGFCPWTGARPSQRSSGLAGPWVTVGRWVPTARIRGAGEPGHCLPAGVTGEERAATG